MPIDGEYEPSPWEPIAEQVDLYESSGGTEGAKLEGQPCIILWTRGARSGKVRKTPLMRVEDAGSYAVIGSMGGAADHPQWVHNLRATPEARLQDGPELRDYAVREVEGAEKARWWAIATQVWPSYDEYQSNTERVIPLFVLDPA
ncbi:MAG: nitroreductase family deazaflavin-dependent oxidoreductase [Actinobacteria bacterium]|nr:nitroreductase family deazaflavin-dependent oxidoreductase [Actinomycetota bacterium]